MKIWHFTNKTLKVEQKILIIWIKQLLTTYISVVMTTRPISFSPSAHLFCKYKHFLDASLDTHSVGGSPLHKDLSPSCRVIFTKASYGTNKQTNLTHFDSFCAQKDWQKQKFLYSQVSHWNVLVFCTSWCNWFHSDTHRCDPWDHYNTGNTSLWETQHPVVSRVKNSSKAHDNCVTLAFPIITR